MKAPFFGQYGNEIEFHNHPELLRKLSDIDCSVPGRTQGRTSDHRERYPLKIYLMRLSQSGLLKFPLRIEKEEAPDFLVSCGGTMMALEVTEAATESYQRAMTELEKSPGTMLKSLHSFNLGESSLRKPGEELTEKWWIGDSVEREWVNIILNAIGKKTEKLNQPHFKIADRYELLLYDNSHVACMLHTEDVLPLLKKAICEKVGSKSSKRNFHSISVIHSEQLLYDIAGKGLVL